MRRDLRAILLTLAMCALVAASAGRAEAAFPGKNGRISFAYTTPNSGLQIATMRPDGSDLRVVVRNTNGSASFESAWSPDARWLAFDRFGTGNNGGAIWRVRSDGSHQQLVVAGTKNSGSLDPSWSPNGRWIVYAHFAANQPHLQIWAAHPNGADAHRVIATSGDDDWPRYSPDGKWIAFTENVPGARGAIAIARADGTHVHRLTATRPLDAFADDWAPNGRWIAFSSNQFHGISSIYTIRPDGTGLRRITRPGRPHYNDVGPAWSPQGDQIAFSRNPCPNATNGCPFTQIAIWVIGIDGSHPHTITHNLHNNYVIPNWGRAARPAHS